MLPEAKSSAEWADADTLLVTSALSARATRPRGGMRARTVRRWRRGEQFAAAPTRSTKGLVRRRCRCTPPSTTNQDQSAPSWDGGSRSTSITESFRCGRRRAPPHPTFPTDFTFYEVHRGWLTLRLRRLMEAEGPREFSLAATLIAIRFDAFAGPATAISFSCSKRLAPAARSAVSIGRRAGSHQLSILDDIAQPGGDRGAWRAAGWSFAPARGVPETETADIGCIGAGGASSAEDFVLVLTGFLRPTSKLHLVSPLASTARAAQDSCRAALRCFGPRRRAGTRRRLRIARAFPCGFQVGLQTFRMKAAAGRRSLYGYGGFFSISMLPREIVPWRSASRHGWSAAASAASWLTSAAAVNSARRWHQAASREHKKTAQDDFAASGRRSRAPPESRAAKRHRLPMAAVERRASSWATCSRATPNAVRRGVVHDSCWWTCAATASSSPARAGSRNTAIPDKCRGLGVPPELSRPITSRATGRNRYPPILLWTSTRADDRVHPGHARKMAARLEARGAPVYFYDHRRRPRHHRFRANRAHAALGYVPAHTIGGADEGRA